MGYFKKNTMITILHNSRCSKSREALAFLEARNLEFQIRYYLEEPLSKQEIGTLLSQLGISVKEVIRNNEKEWKEIPNREYLTDEALVEWIEKTPKLLQRPIVIKGNVAVIARPVENIEKLL